MEEGRDYYSTDNVGAQARGHKTYQQQYQRPVQGENVMNVIGRTLLELDRVGNNNNGFGRRRIYHSDENLNNPLIRALSQKQQQLRQSNYDGRYGEQFASSLIKHSQQNGKMLKDIFDTTKKAMDKYRENGRKLDPVNNLFDEKSYVDNDLMNSMNFRYLRTQQKKDFKQLYGDQIRYHV